MARFPCLSRPPPLPPPCPAPVPLTARLEHGARQAGCHGRACPEFRTRTLRRDALSPCAGTGSELAPRARLDPKRERGSAWRVGDTELEKLLAVCEEVTVRLGPKRERGSGRASAGARSTLAHGLRAYATLQERRRLDAPEPPTSSLLRGSTLLKRERRERRGRDASGHARAPEVEAVEPPRARTRRAGCGPSAYAWARV